MGMSIKAYPNPELLIWARKFAHLQYNDVAQKLKIDEEKIKKWEAGTDNPSISQLRRIAKLYKLSFTLFFLPEPPDIKIPLVTDFRKLTNISSDIYSKELFFEIRDAVFRRQIILELQDDLKQKSNILPQISLENDPETNATIIRDIINLDFKEQQTYSDSRVAFNALKEKIENIGILVFQTSNFPIEVMRGFSIAEFPLPIIVLNRKDVTEARIFTMFHELTHIFLHVSGICDIITEMEALDQRVEEVCNRIAGATLVPQKYFLNEEVILKEGYSENWSNRTINLLANKFSVSREVIVRRLLILDLTSKEFYNQKRAEYKQEFKQRKKKEKSGHIPPPTDVLSKMGKPFFKTLFESQRNGYITEPTITEYSGLKIKHFTQLKKMIGAE